MLGLQKVWLIWWRYRSLSVLASQFLNKVLQRCQLSAINEIELLQRVIESHRWKKQITLNTSCHFMCRGLKCMQTSFYLHEEDEMLEGGVEVGLLLKLHDWVKMLVVNMSVDSKETLQDSLSHWHEVLWKRNTWKDECSIRKTAEQVLHLCDKVTLSLG